MIAARQAMHGGGRKPYDAEVEYLESTGTQWIDTGIILSSETDEIDATFFLLNNIVSQVIFGSRLSVASQNIGCGVGLEFDLFVDMCNRDGYSTWRAATTKDAPSGLYSVNISRQSRTISGVVSSSNTTLSDIFVTPYSCYLFCGSGNFWTPNKFIGRFYSFSIKRNGTPILDLIPVRKGNVGYMYDKVSGKLFGNQGTGDFVLGADKKPADTTVSAKSYVQDGLIAMWDGIENAGWGVHDATATVWKNLVGNGVDFNVVSQPNWGETYAQFDSVNNGFYTDVTDIFEANFRNRLFTMEVAVYQPFSGPSKFLNYGGGQSNNTGEKRVFLLGMSADSTRVGGAALYASARTSNYSKLPQSGTLRAIANDTLLTMQYQTSSGSAESSVAIADEGESGYKRFFIGYRNTYPPDGPMEQGQRIYSIRVYSRPLTAEEIAHNYAVDKERFGL